MPKSRVKNVLNGFEKPLGIGRATLRGVEIVTIPLDEYSALLADRDKLDRILAARPKGFPRSPIDKNPSLSAFILARYGKMTIDEIAAECAKAFRPSPSTSAIQRFASRYVPPKEAP